MTKESFAIGISFVSNILLTFLKIIVGVLFNSRVLVADGIHNAGDAVASFAAIMAMRVSKKPADEDHPWGHGKAEVIAAGIVAVIMTLAALFIGYKSVEEFFAPAPEAHLFALVAAVISLLWKQWLYIYTIRIGKTSNSKGLIATAYDHLADVYASLAAIIGIGAALVGEAYHIPFMAYGDPVSGLVVAFLVLKLSIGMGREAIDTLMEKNLPVTRLEVYDHVISSIPEVRRIDRLRAREHGHYIIVDVRVGVLGSISVQEGHDIAHKIKETVMQADEDVQEVLVHLNPWYEKNK